MDKDAIVPVSFPVVEAASSATAPWLPTTATKLKVQRVRFGAESVEAGEEIVDEPPQKPVSAAFSHESPESDEQADASERGDTPSRPSLAQQFADGPMDVYEPRDMVTPSSSQDMDDIPSASMPPVYERKMLSGSELPPSLSIAPGAFSMDDAFGAPPSLSEAPPSAQAESKMAEREAFAKAAVELAATRANVIAEVEQQLLSLSVSIAQALIEREIEHNPELHGTLARAALATIHDPNGVTLRASREAYAAILDTFDEPMITHEGARVRVELDPTLEGLGVVAENAHVRVDGRIAERLRMVMRAMDEERRRAALEGDS